MNKIVKWHPITDKYMFVSVNKMSDWADGTIVSETHWQRPRYKGQSLTYIVIETSGAKKVFGNASYYDMVGATLALQIGTDLKGPQNLNLVIKEAVNLAVKQKQLGPFNLLKKLYESKIGPCPYDMDENSSADWKTPFDMSKPGGPDGDEDEFERLIDGMTDEIPEDNFVDEGSINESPISDQPNPQSGSMTGHKETRRPNRGNKKTDPDKSTDKKGPGSHSSDSVTDGYSHFKGGQGNLYIKVSNVDQDKASKMAKGGTQVYQKIGKNMKPIDSTEAGITKSNDNQINNTQQVSRDQPSNGGKKPRVIKSVPIGSEEHKNSQNIMKKNDQIETIKQASKQLNAPHTTGKNKDVNQDVALMAKNSEYYTAPSTISDDEFEDINADYWLDDGDENRLELREDSTDGIMPQKEMKLLERLINTKKTPATSKISHFIPPNEAGRGDIKSQAGELCMQYFGSMSLKDAKEARDDILEHLKASGNKACLTKEWVEAAYNNRVALDNYLNVRFGNGEYEIIASAWDTADGVKAMTGEDMHKQQTDGDPLSQRKGYSTDVFFSIKDKDGKIHMLEVSLKQNLGTKLLNSGPKKILDIVPELKGTKLDTVEFRKKELKLVIKEVTEEVLTKALKILVNAKKQKNLSPGQKKDLIAAEGALAKIKGKTAKQIIANLHTDQAWENEKNSKKAAWTPITFAASMGEEWAKDILKKSSKQYVQYQKDMFTEFRKNPKVENAMMEIIREELPILAVLENDELLVAGEYSVDRATLQKVFGENDPNKFKEKLDVYENPLPPFVGYAATVGGDPIPIALIRFRPESLGYGGRIKFDLDMHPKFSASMKRANDVIYGDRK